MRNGKVLAIGVQKYIFRQSSVIFSGQVLQGHCNYKVQWLIHEYGLFSQETPEFLMGNYLFSSESNNFLPYEKVFKRVSILLLNVFFFFCNMPHFIPLISVNNFCLALATVCPLNICSWLLILLTFWPIYNCLTLLIFLQK